MRSILKRFSSKYTVTERGCWQWTAASNGYGRFSIYGKSEYAHRVAFFLYNKRWPIQFVCHSCDNTLCVNPAHLFEGTPKENTHDALRKGRPFGSPSKYPKEAINKTIKLLADGLPQRRISRITGLSQSTISEINRGVRAYTKEGGTYANTSKAPVE